MPFTPEQFFNVFLKYNSYVFPLQILISLVGIFILSLIITKSKLAEKLTSYFLVVLWLWNGIVYHILFFSKINTAAFAFGTLFIIQALFFLSEFAVKKKLRFDYGNKIDLATGYFLVMFGLIIYPAIGLLLEGRPEHIISLGLPCPSVIFTFGIILISIKEYSFYRIIIPVIWAFIGFFAALKFGVYQDVMLPVSAITAIVFFFRERMVQTKI